MQSYKNSLHEVKAVFIDVHITKRISITAIAYVHTFDFSFIS